MKKRKSLIRIAKERICHMYPRIISMDIDMIRLKDNNFRSKIVLKTKTKNFLANKVAFHYKESLNRSCQAIKKQLERVKFDRVHRLKNEVKFEDENGKLQSTDIGGEVKN